MKDSDGVEVCEANGFAMDGSEVDGKAIRNDLSGFSFTTDLSR